jgi:hypothetical protein
MQGCSGKNPATNQEACVKSSFFFLDSGLGYFISSVTKFSRNPLLLILIISATSMTFVWWAQVGYDSSLHMEKACALAKALVYRTLLSYSRGQGAADGYRENIPGSIVILPSPSRRPGSLSGRSHSQKASKY